MEQYERYYLTEAQNAYVDKLINQYHKDGICSDCELPMTDIEIKAQRHQLCYFGWGYICQNCFRKRFKGANSKW